MRLAWSAIRQSRRYRGHARTLFAIGIGNATGLAFPFIVGARLSEHVGDRLLLFTSTGLLLVSVIASTLETAVVAEAGLALANAVRPTLLDLQQLHRRAAANSIIGTLVGL